MAHRETQPGNAKQKSAKKEEEEKRSKNQEKTPPRNLFSTILVRKRKTSPNVRHT